MWASRIFPGFSRDFQIFPGFSDFPPYFPIFGFSGLCLRFCFRFLESGWNVGWPGMALFPSTRRCIKYRPTHLEFWIDWRPCCLSSMGLLRRPSILFMNVNADHRSLNVDQLCYPWPGTCIDAPNRLLGSMLWRRPPQPVRTKTARSITLADLAPYTWTTVRGGPRWLYFLSEVHYILFCPRPR